MVTDLDMEVVQETAALVEKAGGVAAAIGGDLTGAGFPEQLVAKTVAAFGGIDIIVNNAGYTWDNVIQKTTDEQFQAMLDIHVVAPFRVLRAVAEPLRARRKQRRLKGNE